MRPVATVYASRLRRCDVDKDLLFEREEQFWKGDAGFYRQHVAEDGLMVFPEPVGILNKEESMTAIEQAARGKTCNSRTLRRSRSAQVHQCWCTKRRREGLTAIHIQRSLQAHMSTLLVRGR
jgi:hypothetical protein